MPYSDNIRCFALICYFPAGDEKFLVEKKRRAINIRVTSSQFDADLEIPHDKEREVS
jgi:hypothetical protein